MDVLPGVESKVAKRVGISACGDGLAPSLRGIRQDFSMYLTPTGSNRQSLPQAAPSVPSTPLQSSPAPALRCRSSARPLCHCHQVPALPPQSPPARGESPRREFFAAPAHSELSAEILSDRRPNRPAAYPCEP